jgi:formate hydrogenlyase transcriptional activator
MNCDNIVVLGGRETNSFPLSSRGLAVMPSRVISRDYRPTAPVELLVAPDRSVTTEREGFEDIVGCSAALSEVLHQVRTVAPTDSTVLIEGETGTGKELIARAIHNNSRRAACALVTLNCAAIPRELLESEIFGHEKGAFTGAVTRKIGRFEAADRGTLFLDEIGDMPLEVQAKLLRVLQEQEFERVGSTSTQRVNVRVVAATNQDLDHLVSEKQFRNDLYYRLNVFPIFIPPLRDRREDIPSLVAYFASTFAQRMNKHIDKIPSEAMEALLHYDWPGNIRELQNFVERSVVLTTGCVLNPPVSELSKKRSSARPITLKECERDHILRAVQETNWVIAGPHGAAARLGLPRSTLMYRMRKLAIMNERPLPASYDWGQEQRSPA